MKNVRSPETPDSLRQALRALPREAASDDFTARVVRQQARGVKGAESSPRSLRLAWAAGLVFAVLATGILYKQHDARVQAEARRDAVRQRHAELRRDLAELEARAARSPQLYLSAGDGYDVVLDLGPWMEHQPARPTVQPASRNRP